MCMLSVRVEPNRLFYLGFADDTVLQSLCHIVGASHLVCCAYDHMYCDGKILFAS